MRFLILSDIHANWQALDAVIQHAKGRYDNILCCGDIVGYGADPDAVTDWVRENVNITVRGNHDKACAGLEDLEWFNPVARLSAMWTQVSTNPDNIAYLRNLAQGPEQVNGFQILHGSPIDEDEYLITEVDASHVAPYLDSAVSFFGHTHLQGGFLCHRNGIKRIPQAIETREELALENDSFYLINPGSVGQPRDGDPRAAYVTYDSDARLVTYCRVEYDVRAAQQKILKAGLPDILARRLALGN
ncbi:MAG: metallophosphoesterase family protein [Bryobacteraceae bacterium]